MANGLSPFHRRPMVTDGTAWTSCVSAKFGVIGRKRKINIRSAAQNTHTNQRFIDWKTWNNSRNVKVYEDRLSFRSCDGEVALQDRNPCLSGFFESCGVKVDCDPSDLAALTKTNVCVHSTWQRTAKRKKMTAVFAWPSGNLVFLFFHLSSVVQ